MPYFITNEVKHEALKNALTGTAGAKSSILGYEAPSGELVLNNTPQEKIYYNFATGSIRKEPFRIRTEDKTFRVFGGGVPGFLFDHYNCILDPTLDRFWTVSMKSLKLLSFSMRVAVFILMENLNPVRRNIRWLQLCV